ncbi:Ger(x)C family spore germination protein [Paenibacillus sp. GCM10012306]|uniref:Ger(x)C family spore germination protein n=1 Tax=Paenibacillus sp. GCM10012306 TaxID=3317342 RepID=UPI003620E336
MNMLKLGITLMLMLNLTGCWSKVELNELSFVYAVYLDVGNKPNTVELSISSPLTNRLMNGQQSGGGAGSGSSKTYAKVTKTAETVTDALMLIQKDLTRNISLAKIKAIVVGKEYASTRMAELLEWIRREPSLPLGTYIFAAPGRAQMISKLTPTFETLPGEVLMKFGQSNYVLGTTAKQCLIAEASGMGYAINYLSFGNNPDNTVPAMPEYWVGMQGAMLFQKDKMRGMVGLQDARSLAWALGHPHDPVMTVTWDEGKSKVSAVFFTSKGSRTIRMTERGPVFYVTLKGRASLVYKKDIERRSKTVFSRIVIEALEKKAVQDLNEALKKTKAAGADVLELGLLMEWNYPKEWRKIRDRWEDYYKNHAEIRVKANFQIGDYGTEV